MTKGTAKEQEMFHRVIRSIAPAVIEYHGEALDKTLIGREIARISHGIVIERIRIAADVPTSPVPMDLKIDSPKSLSELKRSRDWHGRFASEETTKKRVAKAK